MANIGKRKKQAPKVVSDQNSGAGKESTQGGKKVQNQAVPKVQKNRAGATRGR